MMLSRVLTLLCLVPTLISAATFESFNYQQSGRSMAANNRFIVTIQNRSAPSFSAVQNYTYGSSPLFCTTTFTSTVVRDLYAMMLAVGRDTSITRNTNSFVFVGYSQLKSSLYLVTASINFGRCILNTSLTEITTNVSFPEYSTLGLNSNGSIALFFWNGSLYVHLVAGTNNPPGIQNITFPANRNFYPISIDLLKDWGIITGYSGPSPSSNNPNQVRPIIFIFNFAQCNDTLWNSTCFRFLSSVYPPSSSYIRALSPTIEDFLEDSYNPLYDISVSLNENGRFLIGIQALYTVYQYWSNGISISYLNQRTASDGVTIGFGKSVGWLDLDTVAVLYNTWEPQYTSWKSSALDLYKIPPSSSLSSYRSPDISFPNDRRKLWSGLNQQIVEMIAEEKNGSLIYMDVGGTVHVIRSSPPGWYSQSNNGSGAENVTIYLAPIVPCQSGTTKSQPSVSTNLFLRCDVCQQGTFYQATINSTANQCFSCNSSSSFCPYGAVIDLPSTVLEPFVQLQTYPTSPENDVLEDILLLNMFNVNFSMECITKQPILLALMVIGLGVLILLLMGLLKITKTCKGLRRFLKSIFRQTDLIGEGELWIGGVASFAVLIMCVFAYRFCDGFLKQYPTETAGPSTFACDPKLINAKFSSTMQSTVIPISESNEGIFELLDKQDFTLNVAFISTAFTENLLSVYQLSGTYRKKLNYTLTYRDGILSTSTILPSHTLVVQFQFQDNFLIGAVRVGLSGPSITEENNKVQELNFSEVFNYTSRVMTQDPQITIRLIRSINETQPLSNDDDSEYSAIWTPTFVYNKDQMFYSIANYRLYHTKDESMFIVRLTEASYFISNVEEPITRLTEVIFTALLFSTMCIELFALTFLFYKLAIHSLFKIIFEPWLKKSTKKQGPSSGGCPYCQPFDLNILPAYQVPIQRSNPEKPQYPINRRKSFNLNESEPTIH